MSQITKNLEKESVSNIKNLVQFIKIQTREKFKKKGIVIGVSGGIDSAVVAKLSVMALGKENVYGVLLPEEESAKSSTLLGEKLCKELGIKYEVISITPILNALDIYKNKNNLIKKIYPKFNPKLHKTSMILPSDFLNNNQLNFPHLKIYLNSELILDHTLSVKEYLQIIGLQGVKQRSRMMIQYMLAEQRNYLVIGTTNKTENLLGQFVKYGDGGVDLEPIENFYKTQIYAIARKLKLPKEIILRPPTPDTWSQYTSDEDFFWRMPVDKMDELLFSIEKNISPKKVSVSMRLTVKQVQNAFIHLNKMINTTWHLRKMPPSYCLKK